MSHYSQIKCNITRKSCLIKALQSMGFKAHMIEDLKIAEPLKGYQGDVRQQKANIRIKGSGWRTVNYVGGASNDLGWELQKDGTYSMHLSDYDKNKYNQTWQNKLLQEYAKEVVKEVAAEQHWFVSDQTTETNGELYIKLETSF